MSKSNACSLAAVSAAAIAVAMTLALGCDSEPSDTTEPASTNPNARPAPRPAPGPAPSHAPPAGAPDPAVPQQAVLRPKRAQLRAVRSFAADFLRYAEGELEASEVRNASGEVRRLLMRTPFRVPSSRGSRGNRVRRVQFYEVAESHAAAQADLGVGGRSVQVTVDLRPVGGRWIVTRVRAT